MSLQGTEFNLKEMEINCEEGEEEVDDDENRNFLVQIVGNRHLLCDLNLN